MPPALGARAWPQPSPPALSCSGWVCLGDCWALDQNPRLRGYFIEEKTFRHFLRAFAFGEGGSSLLVLSDILELISFQQKWKISTKVSKERKCNVFSHQIWHYLSSRRAFHLRCSVFPLCDSEFASTLSHSFNSSFLKHESDLQNLSSFLICFLDTFDYHLPGFL